MCGILGIWQKDKCSIDLKIFQSNLTKLRHRGPDDEGYLLVNFETNHVIPCGGRVTDLRLNLQAIEKYFGNNFDLIFGFRRLSILDLSSAGHQPMCNEDSSIWIIHNGEIYNFLEIRKELESSGHQFKSKTDTEMVLHAYEEWGIDCINRFNGMWSFAVMDLRSHRIFCSRDRAGVKPFYYIDNGRRFVFASEIKALLQINESSIEPNEQIIADYLFSGTIDHTQETFFKNIYQLRPGEYLLIENNKLTKKSYWDIEPKGISLEREEDYSERFYELLQDSIRLRLRSDVPIGTCLSGGLDSSTIVCLANQLMFNGKMIAPRLVGERQKTFSSCFENHTYDERKFIELVIRQTGTEKNYVFPQGENFFKDLPQLVWHQDEPFGSTSIYAQWEVMRLAKERGVTVLLDGQGGDELLAGYLPAFYHLFVQTFKRRNFRYLMEEINGFLNNYRITRHQWIKGIFAGIVSNWINPNMGMAMGRSFVWAEDGFRKKYFRNFPRPKKFDEAVNDYLYHNFRSMTLPGLLHYEDRNSLAFSLEARLPFLDYRLVEFIFSLPSQQKIQGGVTKVILRKAMQSILPEEVRNRKDKMGFATPEDIWFRTILKNQIYEIISSKSFADRGYFNINKVKKVFDKYCKGEINVSSMIWRWVNLELWFRTFIDRRPSEIN